MNIDPKALLTYWRNSLSDSGRIASVETAIASAYELSSDEIRAGVVPNDLTRDLFRSEEHHKGDSSKAIPVIILPYVYSARRVHGVANNFTTVKRIAPIIISAALTRMGRLIRDPNARPPVFVRDYLEPNAGPVAFGMMEECDTFYSKHPFQESSWEGAIQYADQLFLAVAGERPENFSAAQWELEFCGRILEASDSVEARHLVGLYNWLSNQGEARTLTALRHASEQRDLLSREEEWQVSYLHRGHPNRMFSLAESQRKALNHFLSVGREDPITVVNGPPGTGKTTLIQSIVASLWVDAALEERECPLIVATSSSNQAVTNVNRAFDTIDLDEGSPLGGRWLPLVSSYGMFLASDIAKARLKASGEKLQTYSQLPRRDNLADYFASYYESPKGLAEGTKDFLSFANRAEIPNGPLLSIATARKALHAEMVKIDSDLRRIVVLIGELSKDSGEFPSLASFETVAGNLKEQIESAAKALDESVSNYSHWKALQQQWKVHRRNEPWSIWLRQLFPKGKSERLARDHDFVRERGLSGNFDQEDPRALRVTFASYSAEMLVQFTAEIEVRQRELELFTQCSAAHLEKLCAFSEWCSEHKIDGDEVGITTVLDTKYRFKLFQLATHYWEAGYLLEVEQLLDESSSYKDGQSPQKLERHYRRLAKLAPCFVSTLHMLPRWCRTYLREESYLHEKIDLLIIDEAAQVSPEVGAVVCSLAKRVFLVGDVHQIEPVQVIPEALDLVNVRHYLGVSEEAEIDELRRLGFLVSSGSLLSLAQKASAFSTHPQVSPGFFLTEHRRCLTPIISFCNELIYQGLLQPKRPAQEFSHKLPPLGWMHCEERSSKRGGSHENSGEAELVVRWLSENSEKLRSAYQLPLKQIVAIITPFTAQVRALRRQISKSGLAHEKITVGTLHTMQGAERPVILFSATYGTNHSGSVFFSRNPRLLNVAVSRAKDAFLVFGSMELFRPSEQATGLLGKYLFASLANELSPLASYKPKYVDHARSVHVIDSLAAHREILRQVLERARREVLIVSPFITERALTADDIPRMVSDAVKRGVRVKIVADIGLNRNAVALKKCVSILKTAGAQVYLAKSRGIHSKVVCRDSDLIVSGSFNWLAAVREAGAFQRFEVSFVQEGAVAAGAIAVLDEELRKIVGSGRVEAGLVGNG